MWQAAHSQSQSLERSNFHHLVLDIAWFGLAFPAINRFLSVYAIRLGADAHELSMLTSLPAIVLLISATFADRWMRHYQDARHALFWPSLGFRLSFLLPALTPFLPSEWQSVWLVLSLTLPALPQGIASVAFLVMMREAVREELVAPLVSRRTLVLNVTVGLSGLALGVWLEKAPFPFNYQAMFVLAFVLAMVSMWHAQKVRQLIVVPMRPTAAAAVNPWRSHGFQRVAFVTTVMHLAFFSVLALVPMYMVDYLDAGEGFMALFALSELVAGALVALVTTRLIHRLGARSLIALGMVGTAVGTLMIAIAPTLNLTLLASAVLGASWTAAAVALFAFFTENTPVEAQTTFTKAYTQIIFICTFVGPLVGTFLYDRQMPLVAILMVGAGLRLLAGVLIYAGHMPNWIKRSLASQMR